MTVLTNATEDAAKTTWDFPPVSGLAEFCDILAVDLKSGAMLVLTYPYPDVVPAHLRSEAEDELGR